MKRDDLLEILASVTNDASMTAESCGQCGELVIVWHLGVCEVREHECPAVRAE